jgi:hypothetical protein
MDFKITEYCSSTCPLTTAAGHPLFENSAKIQRCLTPKAFEGVRRSGTTSKKTNGKS